MYHTDQNQSVSLKVLKGGENGSEEKFDLIPIEKKLVSNGQIITRKLIGFSPKFKTITTYPNPFVLIMQRVKDMYLTLTGLVSPKSDVKLRNMSGPVGIVNHLSIFAKIGFMKLLWFVVFINVNDVDFVQTPEHLLYIEEQLFERPIVDNMHIHLS